MMHLSLCTISFRHHLISLPELAAFASQNGLDGIELWGAHAKNLCDQPNLNAVWLSAYGLQASMLSDYLPMSGPAEAAQHKMKYLCLLAKHWGTTKLRTFAGVQASAQTSPGDRLELVRRLRRYCEQAEGFGLELLIETHPNTYADTTASTLQLLDEVDHPALRVNFDVLHIWEAGEDPVVSWRQLAPFVRHMHLKNISSRQHLNVFEPGNIYSAAGSREGIVPIFEGAYDFRAFLRALPSDRDHSASLEWFGGFAKEVIARDCRKIRDCLPELQTASVKASASAC